MAGQKDTPVITGDMKNNVDRASLLIEALPYIKKMRGQTFVIKAISSSSSLYLIIYEPLIP